MIEDIAEEITETDLSKLKRLGIDEIALVKGQKNYCAVLVNLDTGKLEVSGRCTDLVVFNPICLG